MDPAEPVTTIRVLLVEDSLDDAALAERSLRQPGFDFEVARVESAAAFRSALTEHSWDLIVCDHGLPQFGVFEAIE
ncbi:MAG TPA: response regulator, partial [Acidimicrobiales bacterium]|nr:response regulator [Acidimicrobiales bacterium]